MNTEKYSVSTLALDGDLERLVRNLLDRSGHSCRVFSETDELAAAAAQIIPDVILLGFPGAGYDHDESVSHLHDKFPQVPLLVLANPDGPSYPMELPVTAVLNTGDLTEVSLGYAIRIAATLTASPGSDVSTSDETALENAGSLLPDDESTGVILARDVSGYPMTGQVISESEANYRRLIESCPSALFVQVGEEIVFVNESAATMLGAESCGKLIGRRFHDYLDENGRIRLNSLLSDLEGGNEARTLEVSLRAENGNEHEVILAATGFIYGGKDAVQLIATNFDEQKKNASDLMRARDQAEDLDRLKDAFMANISHEIRTPLNIIMGYSNLVLSELEDQLSDTERQFFMRIEEASVRLMRTVENILGISSIQAGTFKVKSGLLDLIPELDTLISELKPLAAEKQLDLDTTYDIPSLLVYADREALRQTLANLIENAVKFTDEGSVTVELESGAQRAYVHIRDTGVGISEEYLPRLFDDFSQESAGYSRPFEGLGLGLALAKRYAEANDWAIEVASRKGEGTTFSLSLPLAIASESGQ